MKRFTCTAVEAVRRRAQQLVQDVAQWYKHLATTRTRARDNSTTP
jgi:hypothetical protein